MLKKILIGVVVLVGVFVVVVMMRPANYHIERSSRINAPAEVVWAQISDFEQWKSWNPWQKMDPDQKISITGDAGMVGHASHWAGDETGKGSMTISKTSEPTQLLIDLKFDEPMQSEAKTALDVVPQGDAVEVTWSIDGENDFVGKFFGLVMDMEGMIGSAYEEGLADLKRIAEANAQEPASTQASDAGENGAASAKQ